MARTIQGLLADGRICSVKERVFVHLPGDAAYAPETTVPAATMRVLPLAPDLRTHVSHAMLYAEQFTEGEEVVEHVLPDGAVRLIVDMQGDPRIWVIGATAEPVVIRQSGSVHGLSLTLQPGAAMAVLGVPAQALAGQAFTLDELWGQAGSDLSDRIAASGSATAGVSLLLADLTNRLRLNPENNANTALRLRSALDFVADSGGRCTMAGLSRATGLGERRLQQLFREDLGLTPRTWMRLARLHHCLRLMRAKQFSWCDLAQVGGFFDQSHFANEFRTMSGLTPSQFLRISGSSKTSG
jgi:AraC-like DNA-binding protein